MKIIGLTGGIGTGKSTVSNIFKEHHIEIIDADKIARDIVKPGELALLEITEAFGSDILLEDGNLNRGKLADMVFGDSAKLEKLESITMKRIVEIIENKVKELRLRTCGFAIIDAPLLFEAGLDKLCDFVWVVTADEKLRIERVCNRDKITSEQVVSRVKNQKSATELAAKADELIDNSGDIIKLNQRIEELIKFYED